MSIGSISTIINIMLGSFLLIGIMWGMWRGALKSFVRLSFLIINCVFWLIVTPNVSHFLLTADLNPLLNVTIGTETYHTIGEVLNHFLHTNELVLSLVNSSSIMASFVDQIPYIIANFIVFILGYFLVKVLTFPIYDYLMNKILKLFQNKNQEEPKTIRNMVLGGIFGLLQSVLTAIILFLPISTMSAVVQLNTSSLMNVGTQNSQTLMASQTTNETTKPAQNSELAAIVSLYSNTLFYETFDAMKLNMVNEFMFTRLTSVTVNGTKLSLAKEVKNITASMNEVNSILNEQNISLETISNLNETQLLQLLHSLDFNKLEKSLTTLLNLKTIDVVGDDLLTMVYENNLTTINATLNNLPEPILPLAQNLILSVKTGNSSLLKEDIYNLFQIVKTLKENDFFAFTTNKALMTRLQTALDNDDSELLTKSIKEIVVIIIENLKPYNEQQIKENLVAPLFKAQTQRRIMKDVLNAVVGLLNESLDTNIQKIDRVSVSWTNEIPKLSKLVYALKETAYELTPYIKNNTPITLNKNTLQTLPLEQVGTILNTLRESQLFSNLYFNISNELLNTYLFSLEQNENSKLVFINLFNIDWQKDLTVLKQASLELFTAIENYDKNESANLELAITHLIESKLIQEALVQASGILPTMFIEQMKERTTSPELITALDKLTESLQSMTTEELKQDIIRLASLLDELNNTTGKPFLEFLLDLNEVQINRLVTQIASSSIVKNMLPEVMNLFIARMNEQLNIATTLVPENIQILSSDITKLSNAIYALKTVYLEIKNAELTFEEFDLNQLNTDLGLISIEKVGFALDELKSIPFLKNTYSSFMLETIFNKNFIGRWLPSKYLPYFSFNTSQMNQISWELEIAMAKNALSIVTNMKNIEEKGYDSILLNEFLTQYGNSLILKTGFMNGVAYLYPETDATVLKEFNLQQNAQAIGGIGEFVFQFLDFKYNGVVKFESMERYRIREGFKKLGATADMTALLKELTGVTNLDFNQLAFVADVLYDVLEGKEFSLKAFAPYLDITPLIPWVVELIQKISVGYKMPYYLNIYMNPGITKVKLYGIHLGKSSMENDKGEKQPINITQMLDLLKYLAYVPDFITAKFIFDPTFTQPIPVTPSTQTAIKY